ncbi:MAG: hypothetical protein AAF230_00745 [Pseudomonadota bacterium]
MKDGEIFVIWPVAAAVLIVCVFVFVKLRKSRRKTDDVAEHQPHAPGPGYRRPANQNIYHENQDYGG